MKAEGGPIYNNLRPSDHITNALVNLHWFRSQERVQLNVAVLMLRL